MADSVAWQAWLIRIFRRNSRTKELREIAKLWEHSKGEGRLTADFSDFRLSIRGIDVEELAKADPGNIQRIGASQLELNNSYYQDVLKRARHSFTAAIVAAAVGLTLFLCAIGIALARDKIDAAALSAIGGAIVETIAGLNFWLYGRASGQLDAFHVRLDRTNTILLANSVCTNIEGSTRDAVRGDLARAIVGISPPGEATVTALDSPPAPVREPDSPGLPVSLPPALTDEG